MVDEMVAVTTCLRCGHNWLPRVESPIRCPTCKSPYWGKPRSRATGLGSSFGRPGLRTGQRAASPPQHVPLDAAADRTLIPFED